MITSTLRTLIARVRSWRCCFLFVLVVQGASSAEHPPRSELWALKPVVRPEIPRDQTDSTNPIDAFISAEYRSRGLRPTSLANKRTLLRRVYLDLIGIPPSPEEQSGFLQDSAPNAYEKVVDRLLASQQYGVRYARHWLDVLRYADVDDRMVESSTIYHWRDWVINALNEDVPYDEFVRAQLTGSRPAARVQISNFGQRLRVEPRADDLFALGFLARGALRGDGKGDHELAIAAVETVSTAFMGMTVGCAKCHDHMYDPISQRDFYAMKALFDPLVARKVSLGTAADFFASGRARQAYDRKHAAVEARLNAVIGPFKTKLYDERVALLPADVQVVIRKLDKDRTPAERKVADDYFPVLRIDPAKLIEVMPEEDRRQYEPLRQELAALEATERSLTVPFFWTVEVDQVRAAEKSYQLTSGDPDRPEKDHEVSPGWPFAPAKLDLSEGRIEAFSDWLTAADNPLFARVAVNRLWQWHFGQGLQKTASDFGQLGGTPSHPGLLDWLASEFVRQGFRMKEIHRLLVTSKTYQLASQATPDLETANSQADPSNTYLWKFRLQRLEAEPIWDSILAAAGTLDLTVGGPSFEIDTPAENRRTESLPDSGGIRPFAYRRAAYAIRGFSTSRTVMADFLQAFDVDDGRVPCPLRNQTVTAPQSLFFMNSREVDEASGRFAERLQSEAGGQLAAAVQRAFERALARLPSTREEQQLLAFLENDWTRLRGLAWLMFNLDEFIYPR